MVEKVNLLDRVNGANLFEYAGVGQLNGHVLSVLQAENRTLPFHTHASSDELFYVIEGSMELEFDDGLLELNVGELAIVPKGIRHRPVCGPLVKCLLIESAGTLTGENTGGSYVK